VSLHAAAKMKNGRRADATRASKIVPRVVLSARERLGGPRANAVMPVNAYRMFQKRAAGSGGILSSAQRSQLGDSPVVSLAGDRTAVPLIPSYRLLLTAISALLNCRETIPRNIQASPIVMETRAARELRRSPGGDLQSRLATLRKLRVLRRLMPTENITGGTKEPSECDVFKPIGQFSADEQTED